MKLKIDNLSHTFGVDSDVLKNVSLDLDFSSLAIIGQSGSGKSTLLRLIAALLEIESGTIEIGAFTLGPKIENLMEYRKKIGFVFQQNALFKHMTSAQNIEKPLIYVHGYSKGAAQLRSHELLTRFGIADKANSYPKQLSGGEQQRVAIARAIAAKPELLLLDEPTSALDPEYTSEVLSLISELAETGLNLIIVTHEMGFARNACEKVAFLSDGAIHEVGNSADLFSNPRTDALKEFLSKLLEWSL